MYDGQSVPRPRKRCRVSCGGRISRTSSVTAMAMTASLNATTRAGSRSTPNGVDLPDPRTGSVTAQACDTRPRCTPSRAACHPTRPPLTPGGAACPTHEALSHQVQQDRQRQIRYSRGSSTMASTVRCWQAFRWSGPRSARFMLISVRRGCLGFKSPPLSHWPGYAPERGHSPETLWHMEGKHLLARWAGHLSSSTTCKLSESSYGTRPAGRSLTKKHITKACRRGDPGTSSQRTGRTGGRPSCHGLDDRADHRGDTGMAFPLTVPHSRDQDHVTVCRLVATPVRISGGDVPGPLQPRHAFGIRRVRRLEVPARPGREPQEPRCPGTAEVVLLRRTIERPPGVPHGAEHIAPSQGLCGTVQLDRPREAAKFLVVDDDHLRRWGLGSLTDILRCVQPPLGVPQSGLNALELAASQQRPGKPNAEHGPDAAQLVGKRLEPATHRGLLPAPTHGRNG